MAVVYADLQDPPELIAAMLSQWRLDYEVLYGRRRQEGMVGTAGYWFFYRRTSG